MIWENPMARNPQVYRRADARAHFRTLIFSPMLFAMSVFLGKLAYETNGQFPFKAGTTVLLGILSFVAFVLAALLITGRVSISEDPDASYYY